MMSDDNLLAILLQKATLSAADMEALQQYLRPVQFTKAALLIEQNSYCDQLYFVTEGICRHYFFDADGKEITSWFSEAGMLATDYRAFTEQVKAVFNIQAVTDCTCIAISFRQLQGLYNSSKGWERAGRLINQQYLNQLIERNSFMFTKTSRQRYEEFAAQRGHLFNLVLLKHIASYLGMTLETLSRLRAGKY